MTAAYEDNMCPLIDLLHISMVIPEAIKRRCDEVYNFNVYVTLGAKRPRKLTLLKNSIFAL